MYVYVVFITDKEFQGEMRQYKYAYALKYTLSYLQQNHLCYMAISYWQPHLLTNSFSSAPNRSYSYTHQSTCNVVVYTQRSHSVAKVSNVTNAVNHSTFSSASHRVTAKC